MADQHEDDHERQLVHPLRRKHIATRAVLEQWGNSCAFPDCKHQVYLELAAIRAEAPGGPRYEPGIPTGTGTANLIILCPNHHRMVDGEPHRFSVEVLERMREAALARARAAIEAPDNGGQHQALGPRPTSLGEALGIWERHATGENEDFWHRLFEDVPELLTVAVPGDAIQYGSKCYVGGKTVRNVKGNIVDFLYQQRSTLNVTMVEIKTPDARLIGSAYRNMFVPSAELAGSVVQALGYRDSLQKDFYNLVRDPDGQALEVFNPKALVVVGNLEAEHLDAARRRSFELFRHGLSGVIILTFDELFRKVRDLVDLVDSELNGRQQ